MPSSSLEDGGVEVEVHGFRESGFQPFFKEGPESVNKLIVGDNQLVTENEFHEDASSLKQSSTSIRGGGWSFYNKKRVILWFVLCSLFVNDLFVCLSNQTKPKHPIIMSFCNSRRAKGFTLDLIETSIGVEMDRNALKISFPASGFITDVKFWEDTNKPSIVLLVLTDSRTLHRLSFSTGFLSQKPSVCSSSFFFTLGRLLHSS